MYKTPPSLAENVCFKFEYQNKGFRRGLSRPNQFSGAVYVYIKNYDLHDILAPGI